MAQPRAKAVSGLPESRRLRVLEVGAGTGGTTGAVAPELPAGRTDYVYTDLSAGFLTDAAERFSGTGARVEARVLDIERDPGEQGFRDHAHDLLLAANVLHATRDLRESLEHCRRLLAPAGLLLALEAMEARAWLDLTFGLLPGWWRFADAYRTEHPLVTPPVWRRALRDADFEEVEILAGGRADGAERTLGAGVILARAPREPRTRSGLWVVCPEDADPGRELVSELENRGQRVIAAPAPAETGTGRDAWREFFAGLPETASFAGVVHLDAVSGCGEEAAPAELREDVERTLGGALSLTQGLLDAGVAPRLGLWFVTRGGQIVAGGADGEAGGPAVRLGALGVWPAARMSSGGARAPC